MIKGKHIQQAFGGFDPDNFGICGVRGVGISGLYARLKRQRYTYKWTINLKKQIKNIGSLIEGWCKKKLVFAHPLLPFGTVGVANAHCTHLQIAQANPQTEICKRVQFLPTLNKSL